MEDRLVSGVGPERLREFMNVLQRYKSGKGRTEQRILSSENWWKLRNDLEEGQAGQPGFQCRSGWLHNVIVSKHADAVEAFPEPNILPREASDRQEARMLSSIIPCVLEQNQFENTYSDVMWQKLKTGTGVYKVVWDRHKLRGLGDISIKRVNLLNLYWEPGITDIQNSRYLFHTELWDKDVLLQTYPQLDKALKSSGFLSTRFLYDDAVDTQNKATVIEVYYHKTVDGVNTLQYCKFVEDQVLFSSEEDPEMAKKGLYDHGMYPYVFDVLYPIEGSPCGYGFVDLCRNPQTAIDLLGSAFIKNARVGAVPRYFSRIDGNVNQEEFLDLNRAVVTVSGNVDETTLRRIEHNPLDGNYIAVLDRMIEQLRQTSGNTDASTGAAPSGVTAASAIAALQEASGKGSRDSTLGAYRAYSRIVELCIELIRQFYSLPRQFRISGPMGRDQFVAYSNLALQPQALEYGYRVPVFDIRVSAQKKNVYTKVSQNELALQFFQLGFFDPARADQALMCLEMMDFDDKDIIMQRIDAGKARLQSMQALALRKAQPVQLTQTDNFGNIREKEHVFVRRARQQALSAGLPDSGNVKED